MGKKKTKTQLHYIGTSESLERNLNIFIIFSLTAVSCSIPELPPRLSPLTSQCNGGLSIHYTESCSYSCDVGYNLVGSPSVTCLANTSLSDFLPSCEGKNLFSIFQMRVDFGWRFKFVYSFLNKWLLEISEGFMVKSHLLRWLDCPDMYRECLHSNTTTCLMPLVNTSLAI